MSEHVQAILNLALNAKPLKSGSREGSRQRGSLSGETADSRQQAAGSRQQQEE